MKKFLSIALSICIFLSLPTHASEGKMTAPFQSQNISEDTKAILLNRDYYDESMAKVDISNKFLIRAYWFFLDDALDYPLDQLTKLHDKSDIFPRTEYYMAGKELISLHYNENKMPTVSLCEHSCSPYFLSYASLSDKPNLTADYNILDAYVFLPNNYHCEGAAVYYITDHGVFLEYFIGDDGWDDRSKTYAQEDFLTIRHSYGIHLKQTEGLLESPPDFMMYMWYIFGTNWDKGAFLLQDRTVFYSIISAVGACALGTATVFGISFLHKRIKKKRTQPNTTFEEEGGAV